MKPEHAFFVEAESFRNLGGWVVDQQSMETLHSSYIMAHGMGTPVPNATTTVTVEQPGTYHAWVLCRDWTAVWNVKDSAGLFQLVIDGNTLPHTLGNASAVWDWQEAGTVELSAGEHTLELHDLTGFNGRCDALYFTTSNEKPSNQRADIDALRCQTVEDDTTPYDLIVVGAGAAGLCTAIAAAREGLSVLVLGDRPVLGGCNSSEIRVCMGGHINIGDYPKLGNVVRQIAPIFCTTATYEPERFEDNRKQYALDFAGVSYRLGESVTAVEMDGKILKSVITTNIYTGKKTRFFATLFSDCSGDAVVARLCGNPVMYGNDSRAQFGETLAPPKAIRQTMGHSIRWYAIEQDTPTTFPKPDWGLHFTPETYLDATSGDWEQETGFRRDMVGEIEYIRDYGLRAIYSNWSYQKNEMPERFQNYQLKWVSPLGGKRESYRIVGDYILTQHDLEAETQYDDGTAASTWTIDIHYPEPTNADAFGEAFRSFAYHRGIPKPCHVPYRCLYAREVDNLFCGGRALSASHVGLSSIRVMRTLGMLGEVVGLAAGICKRENCLPRAVYTDHLDALKAVMKRGANLYDAFTGGFPDGHIEEKYHFKDIGYWNLDQHGTTDSQPVTAAKIAKYTYCVDSIGLEHKNENPTTWRYYPNPWEILD